MKITDIVATPVAVPLEKAETTSRMRKGPNAVIAVIVEVHTDEGIVGIGETPAVLGVDLSTAIVNSTKPLLLGRDAKDINVLMKRLYVVYNANHLHHHAASWAFSGIELALWDIAARKAGVPLYQLWGGSFRDKIELIGIIERQDLDGMEREARRLSEAGFRTIYTKLGMDPDDDVAAVAAMRRGASDPGIVICGDANQAWPVGVAVNTINRMEPYGMGWIEQPTIRYNLKSLSDVKHRTAVPILGHEVNWTMYELINVLRENCVDCVKLDGRFDAGYTGVRISAGMAEAAGIPCVHHSFFQLGISLAGSLHVMASCPNFTLASSWGEYGKMIDDVIIGGPLKMKTVPYLEIPTAPGIGVELDRDKLALYHSFYQKEIYEKGYERETERSYYTAMFMRPYFKDILD